MRYLISLMLCLTLGGVTLHAKGKELSDVNYRRNSLKVVFDPSLRMLVTEKGVEDSIMKFLNDYELSDKYDPLPFENGNRKAEIQNYASTVSVSDEDILKIDPKFNKKSGSFGLFKTTATTREQEDAEKREFLSKYTNVVSASTEEEYKKNTTIKAARLLKYLESKKMANRTVASWFNGLNGGQYDMELIKQRGLYSASELDKMEAQDAKRGLALVEDAGEDLIGHTFIAFTDFEIIDGRKYEERNKAIHAELWGTTSKFGKYVQKTAEQTANETAGYYITSTTYLFQLEWSDKLAEKFYAEYWNQPVSKLLESDLFHYKYLGFERNVTDNTENINGDNLFSYVGNSLAKEFKSGRIFEEAWAGSEAQKRRIMRENDVERFEENEKERKMQTLAMTEQSLIRSIDQTHADLMKNHEEFKVKTPILEVADGYVTAFIGKKEGVTAKTEFEVLEPRLNETTNRMEYVKVGKAKVDKKRLWDNRFTLVDNGENIRGKGENQYVLDRTYLKCSSGKVAPGMLLRQIK